MTSRRDFIRGVGATAALTALYSHDLIAEIIATSPSGRVMESRFKGMADIALATGKTAGCSYVDIRFTMTGNLPGAMLNFTPEAPDGAGRGRGGRGGGARGGGGGAGGGGGGGGGGRGRGGVQLHSIPTDMERVAGGFGVRVIHSGVWGFASSPITTEDEIKRITLVATDVAKASAIAKKANLQRAPQQSYQVNYVTPMKKPPLTVSQTDKQAWAQSIVDKAKTIAGVTAINVTATQAYEWKYYASSEGSYIEQELYTTTPNFTVTAKVGDVTRTRQYPGVPAMGGWEIAEQTDFLPMAEQVATDAVEMCTAKPLGGSGLKDVVMSPSHQMLTIHEIVAHATEIDRIVGYEANYAGTSFVKISDIGKLKYGSKLMNITADKTDNGLGSYAYDDDGVEAQKFPIIRDGILVGLQTNRETAHLLGENKSRGCTFANSWRDYPFLRMPNVHLEPGGPGSPTKADLIADVKDGVMIDGRGSYSIDQQRYNGQFGGHIFWEIKNGKITRQCTDVTYNAITTDFWASLDGITGPNEYKKYGTGGDAKGQPTQTNSISHGSPWTLIRKLMVGAAFD